MKSFHFLRDGFTAILAALLFATSGFAETREEPVQTFPFGSDGLLNLDNVDGDVTIEGWDKNEVEIRAVKNGKSKHLDRIKIAVEVTESSGRHQIDIETQYPFLSGSSGRVDFLIKVPSSTTLEDIELVDGDITIKGITGSVSVATVNGSISAAGAAASAWVETVNGSLDLSFDVLEKGQSVDATSVNGAITLRLPAEATARIEAETVNGRISNGFALEIEKGEWIGTSMEGRLGSGDARIRLETVNGNIEVQKR